MNSCNTLREISKELRYVIFEMLLQSEVEIDETTRIEPAILRTCRQFYIEAKHVLYSKHASSLHWNVLL